MKLFTKEELIAEIKKISFRGWHKSVKKTIDRRNDGAVGNTLEVLLGIKENNLPIPNAQEWELKGQRMHTNALITLKHIEPSPRAARIVPTILLPKYGWRHKKAGTRYPDTEMSFRSTTSAIRFTNRGFRLVVDKEQRKICFVFNAKKADISNPEIASWLSSVEKRIGLGPLEPEPYWGFEDLKYAIGEKIRNCFYVVADTKVENKREFFHYKKLCILADFDFEKLLECFEKGVIFIDFDARTGHNHGTKFRIMQEHIPELYSYTRNYNLTKNENIHDIIG